VDFNRRLVRGIPNGIADNILDRAVEQLWATYGSAFARRVQNYATSAVTGFEIGILNHLPQEFGNLYFLPDLELITGFHSRNSEQVPDHSVQLFGFPFYASNRCVDFPQDRGGGSVIGVPLSSPR
jgi:hypothetical protein